MLAATKVIILLIKILSAHSQAAPGTTLYECIRHTCTRIMAVLFTRGDNLKQDDFTYHCYLAARDQKKQPCPTMDDCSTVSFHPCLYYRAYGTTAEKFIPAHCPMQNACQECLTKKYCAKYTVKPFHTSPATLEYLVCSADDVKKICPKCSCYNTAKMNEINNGWKNPATPTSPQTTTSMSTAATPGKPVTDSNTSAQQHASDPSNKTDKKETKSSSSVIITAVVVCIAALVAVIVGAVQITKMVMKSHDESQRSRRRKDEAALTSGVSKRSTSHMSGRSSLMFAPTPEDSRISRSPSVSGKAEKD